jgi:hypothetical protein
MDSFATELKQAADGGVQIVSVDWIDECLTQKSRVDTKDFLLVKFFCFLVLFSEGEVFKLFGQKSRVDFKDFLLVSLFCLFCVVKQKKGI